MLGLIVKPYEADIAREFFQLFKTPWEPYDPTQSYDVVLSTGDSPADCDCKLFLLFTSESTAWDALTGVEFRRRLHNPIIEIKGCRLPIHGEIRTLPVSAGTIGTTPNECEAPGFCVANGHRQDIRFGYDLFAEVAFLLTRGQDPNYACFPTLDVHINLLRRLVLDAGLPVIEIPPVPAGSRFISCLTHDIDFVSLRQHRFDRATLGFFYRATLGTAWDYVRGRCALSRLVKNAAAVCKWPLVQVGICEDFWLPFQRYLDAEHGKPSTYFLIPFKDRCGHAPGGRDARHRAVRYDVGDLSDWLPILRAQGCEVAVHGIDAWNDTSKGVEELERLAARTGERNPGLRMHWLYFSQESPRFIESAGFDYDSTCGYNDAVGFRAGTSQVFQPPGTKKLLELPLHVQDTAMFFPGRMHLTESEAWALFSMVLDHCRRHGGVLTVLWHDRSLAPERLWDDFYAAVLKELSTAQTWFATAGNVVRWFRARREVRFCSVSRTNSHFDIRLEHVPMDANPDMVLRLTLPQTRGEELVQIDTPLKGRKQITVQVLQRASQCAEAVEGPA